jgi:hypothetical protein
MVISVKIVRVFVGSPSELSEERVRLDEVVREVNLLAGVTLGLRLELVKWERDTYPGIGAEPQNVIDEQIGDTYDIFMGMLWTKFGTPTHDADSGTEHEFQRAYLRHKKDPDKLKIMFYFKDGQISPSQLNAEQLLKVEQFKKKLGESGLLYWTYKTTDEFANLTRIHLTKQLQNWDQGVTPKSSTQDWALAQSSESTELVPQPGFLDFLELVEENFQTMNGTIEQMGKAVEELGLKMTQRTAEINQGHVMDQSSKIRYWKRVSNAMADDLEAFCIATEARVPVFGKSYRQGTSAMARAVAMAKEFGGDLKQQTEELSVRMKSLSDRLGQVRALIQSFRDTIKSTPRVTAGYITAQSHAVAVLTSLDNEYEGAERHTTELMDSLKALTQNTN